MSLPPKHRCVATMVVVLSSEVVANNAAGSFDEETKPSSEVVAKAANGSSGEATVGVT